LALFINCADRFENGNVNHTSVSASFEFFDGRKKRPIRPSTR